MNPLFDKPKVGECDKCKLYKKCLSPKMKYTGDGKKKILLVGSSPDTTEDIRGEQFVGTAGTLLRDFCYDLEINIDTDCWKTNVVKCKTPEEKDPTNGQIKYCRPFFLQEIEDLKPEKIILFGIEAVNSFMKGKVPDVKGIREWIGWKIPDEKTGAWIYPIYSPLFINKMAGKGRYETLFAEHLQQAIKHNEPFPEFSKRNFTSNILSGSEAIDFMDLLKKQNISIDYETTGLKPFIKGHRIVSMSIATDPYNAYGFLITDKMRKSIRRILNATDIGLRAQNLKFERMWSKVMFGTAGKRWLWDSMIASHLLNNQTQTGLKFQTYVNFGIEDYSKKVDKYLKADTANGFNQIDKIPVYDLLTYNNMDTIFECRLSTVQREVILKDKKLFQAYNLIHSSLPSLSDTEIAGFKVDMDFYHQQKKGLSKSIIEQEEKLLSSKEGIIWKKKYGSDMNFNSSQQVANVLFNICKHKSDAETKTGKKAVDQATLEKLKIPFVVDLVKFRKLNKLKGTYLNQMIREVSYDYVHPIIGFFPVSWRSSVNSPSYQNFPSRDKVSTFMIKNGIIPRPGNRFLDSDQSTIEVRGAAWYTKDPKLLEYLWDPTTDMHKDTTMDCFKLEPDEVHKEARKCGKNSFVFPEFYGDYYVNCATNLWEDIDKYNLQTTKGIPLKQHLKKHGIKTYLQFEKHIREVEDIFWNDRFTVYTKWKEDTWQQYLEQGYLESFFGFKFSGSMDRNDALNYQIQSTAFHCVLWAYARIAAIIKKNKMKTILIGETHDSMVKDVPPDEFDEIVSITKKVMVDDLIDNFPWINTPIEIEIEATGIDKSWFTKEIIEHYRKEPIG